MRAKLFRSVLAVVALPALMTHAIAQANDAAPRQPIANAPATGADIYVYPTNGQSDRQLDRDRYECHGWAGKQTGYDPTQSSLPRIHAATTLPPDHRGAVSGAVAGAVIGATVSGPHDSAEGAMVGAVAGAVLGAATDVARAREAAGPASRQAAADQAEQARREKQAYDYRRAITACLEGRGYTVK